MTLYKPTPIELSIIIILMTTKPKLWMIYPKGFMERLDKTESRIVVSGTHVKGPTVKIMSPIATLQIRTRAHTVHYK